MWETRPTRGIRSGCGVAPTSFVVRFAFGETPRTRRYRVAGVGVVVSGCGVGSFMKVKRPLGQTRPTRGGMRELGVCFARGIIVAA